MVLIKVILLVSFAFSSTFENVKVLDIESRSEMKKYMKSIAKDLGVKVSELAVEDDTPVVAKATTKKSDAKKTTKK